MKNGKHWIHAGKLSDLRSNGYLLTHTADRPVAVFWSEGQARAVDNRCPHMGFPMHKGTVRDGVITCHWHHARFDLKGGCAFDLFADDLPAFDVKIEQENVYIASESRQKTGPEYYRRRLRHGLEQEIGLIQAKAVVGLIESGEDFSSIAGEMAAFASRNSEGWGDGLTFLALVGNLWPVLSSETRTFALAQAARRVAANAAGRPARRLREPLENGPADAKQLRRWLMDWVATRHRDGVERTLLTAVEYGTQRIEIADMLVDALGCRVYVDSGHTLDAVNKAFEFVSLNDESQAAGLLSLLAPDLAMGRGEEESSEWRNPNDLVRHIRNAEAELPECFAAGDSGIPDLDEWTNRVWHNSPEAIFSAILESLRNGMTPWRLAQGLAAVAALRLARFAASNDIADWFGPAHAFIFANALCRILQRKASAGAVKQLLHVAGAIYIDRFVNVPAARLPSEGPGLGRFPDESESLRRAMLESLDRRGSLDTLPGLVVRYLQCGHDRNRLIDTMVYATVREDLDFHKLQVWEAAWQQAQLWENDRATEVLFCGAARHLAAHCPTRRSEAQMTRIALRLHRGETLYEESGPTENGGSTVG